MQLMLQHHAIDVEFQIVTLEVKFDLIVEEINNINQAYFFYVQCFIDGGKAKHVESMVFDGRGQARKSGM
jgi:hypothetical protein